MYKCSLRLVGDKIKLVNTFAFDLHSFVQCNDQALNCRFFGMQPTKRSNQDLFRIHNLEVL